MATVVSVRGHRGLVAWQKAMELVTEIYRITKDFPRDELYGLVVSSGERPFRFRATSRKGTDGIRELNSITSWVSRGVPWQRLKRKSRSPRTYIT